MGRKNRTNDDFIEELKVKRPTILPLEPFNGVDKKIKCKCLVCSDTFYTTPYVLLNSNKGNGCRNCNGTKQKTHLEYVQELIDKNIPVTPLEKYSNNHTKIKHKCNICSYEWDIKPANILSGFLCPACANKKVFVGYNDLWTTHPHIAELLYDKNDGYKYTYGSGKKVKWKCKDCGYIVEHTIQKIVHFGHVPCKKCSDGISYPMKFTMSVLDQLNIDYDTEVRFDWCKYVFKGKETYGIYDMVFDYMNHSYIIEVDGGFHFKTNNMSGQTKEESQFIDNAKDNCALNNGYNMIRIIALESNLDYMKDKITNSLCNLFDLDNIDWEKANIDALSSLVVESAKLWNQYHSANTISQILNKRQEIITRYLNKATKAGLCDYDGKLEQIKSGKRSGESRRKMKLAKA